jgi:two-component system sensor histidine kinase EvgS
LNIHVDDNVPKSLLIDEVRIRQILFNLVSNSLKFTIEGSIDIRITTSSIEDKYTNLILEVEDTGVGIDNEQQKHMFEAFSQHSNQSNKVYGGTGLGLAITKQLVELMGGNISLKSQRDVGSSFIVTLQNIEISDMESIAYLAKNTEVIFEKATLLITDDLELNRVLLREYFKDTKLQIIEAKDGQEAVDAVKENDIDIILMDIRMPNKNGYEATKEIKEFSNVPIIAITASVISQKNNEENSIFDDFLHKPVEIDILVHSMSKFLKCEIKTIKNTSISLDTNIENISLEKYPELLELLNKAKEGGDIDLIQEFANELDSLGEKNNIEVFQKLSVQISSAVNSFDIGECELLLGTFE